MRKSAIPSVRASHIGSLAGGSQSASANAHLHSKLIEKKKEFEALTALDNLAAEHVRRLEAR